MACAAVEGYQSTKALSLVDAINGGSALESVQLFVAPIEGVPAFITDNPGYSQGGDIANTDLSMIETPNMPDREQWIRKLAQCHWSFEDLRSGRCWAHMRNWVKIS